MLKVQPTERNFIVITLLLVVILGAQTFNSLLKEEIDVPGVIAEANVTGDRQPASFGGVKPLAKSLSQLVDLDLSCSKKWQKNFSVTGTFLQLKGKNCLKSFDQEHIQIVNQTNGYTASVFTLGQNQYQTDLIQLREGENQIKIRHESKGKVFEETLSVRASAI